MDDRAFVNLDGWRKTRRAQWGRREWPPLIKVQLQSDDSEHAESGILELAASLYEFNCKL
jgi:hypothetical protein